MLNCCGVVEDNKTKCKRIFWVGGIFKGCAWSKINQTNECIKSDKNPSRGKSEIIKKHRNLVESIEENRT